MTIQEYIRIQAEGKQAADMVFFRPYFLNMNCRWCLYNGYACRTPQGPKVCMEYRVEKMDINQKTK